jgi:hypothetical protein
VEGKDDSDTKDKSKKKVSFKEDKKALKLSKALQSLAESSDSEGST